MFSIHPIEVMWAQAPSDIKVNLSLSLIVEILKIFTQAEIDEMGDITRGFVKEEV